jgi:hypothetical protein
MSFLLAPPDFAQFLRCGFQLYFFKKAMNTIKENYGLSARQQAIPSAPTALRAGCLFTTIILVMMLTVVATSCSHDTHGQDNASVKKNSGTAPDSADQPNVNIRVNRKYDDKGNLVGFDSTYSSYYSKLQGDTSRMDSLMKGFDKYFDRNYSRLFDQQFNTLFFNDSLRYPDFFHNDFFMKRYELNDTYLRGMMRRMDSIKNRFYQEAPESPPSKGKK